MMVKMSKAPNSRTLDSPRALTDDVCGVFTFDRQKVRALRPVVREVDGLAEIFRVLSDPTRTKIVYALSKAELCVCDIANILRLSVGTISHHLRLLRTQRLVKYRREGRMVFYSLDDDHIVRLIAECMDHVQEKG